MKHIAPGLLAAILAMLLTGCGSGGSLSPTASPVSATGRAVLTIHWPERTRLIPDASNSILVVVKQGATQAARTLLPRPVSGVSSAAFDALPIGTLSVTATAFPSADGSGTAQAAATVPLVILANQTAGFSLTMASTIDHLDLTPANGQVNAGSTLQLTVAAKDAAGSVVLLAPKKLGWLSADTALATVDANGLVTGLKAGSVSISVTDTESGKSATASIVVVQPVPILYDGFAYNVGEGVAGQNGGTGNWGSAWNEFNQGSTSSVVQAGSLTFANLATSGNSIVTTSDRPVGHARRFAIPPTFGASGTTLYISFLVKPVDALNVGSPFSYYSLVFGTVNIGKGGRNDFYGMENDAEGGPYYSTGKRAVTNQTAFLVVRFTFRDGVDTCDMWVNPTPGQPLPATPDATKSDTDTGIPNDFNIGSSIRTVFDEIRFGRTWEEVSPVQ